MVKKRKFNFDLSEATLLLTEIEKVDKSSKTKIKKYPYKDTYLPLLTSKYNSHPQKVLKIMNFIYNDLIHYLPENEYLDIKGLNRSQSNSLRKFIQVVDSSYPLSQDAIWEYVLKIFKLTSHERFTESEIRLFKMCIDCLNKNQKEVF